MVTAGQAEGPPRIAPRHRGWPILGALPAFARDPLGFVTAVAREYGPVVELNVAGHPTFLLTDLDGVQRVLIDNHAGYGKRGGRSYRILRRVLGNGLVTSDGAFWLRQRRISAPAFHRERLAGFSEQMAATAEAMIERWRPWLVAGKPFDLAEELSRVTLRIVGQALLSTDLGPSTDRLNAAFTYLIEDTRKLTTQAVRLPDWVPTPRNRAFWRERRSLDALVLGLIAERRKQGTPFSPPGRPPDLLSMLMSATDPETGESMTDQQLLDEVVTLLFAGHETTASALSWTQVLLCRHPEVAAKLRSELETLGGRVPRLHDLGQLTYLEAVVKEAMRLYPPVWMIGRVANADDVLGGFLVPKGSLVAVSIWVLNHHPELWSEPERFEPERWLGSNPVRHRVAYLPFSSGPRKCIGDAFAMMEARIVLAAMTQHTQLTLLPGQNLSPKAGITLRPVHGVQVVAAPRS